jgi:AcrR family transcriptional regulator
MARTRAADHEQHRQRILAAAVSAFAEFGYASASMSALAQACGVSKAGLYHYYPSKEALLFDALDGYTRRLVVLADSVRARGLPPRERLAELVRAFVREYRDARGYHVALLNDVKFLAEPQREAIRLQERAVVRAFADAIAAAYPGAMSADVAMPTTMALLGMINFTFAWLRPDGPMDTESFAELVIRLWARGLQDPGPQAPRDTVPAGRFSPPQAPHSDRLHP